LVRALRTVGRPGVLKTRRLGYDGKGQAVVRTIEEAWHGFEKLRGVPLIYEEFVPFDFEVSIIGARSRSGEIAIYPLNRNLHRDGILRLTRAPFGPSALQRRAARHLRRVLEHFRYEGVLNVEFFVRRGKLIANETAPRVHNSGHWTIEGAATSQFENHLRADFGAATGRDDGARPRGDDQLDRHTAGAPARARDTRSALARLRQSRTTGAQSRARDRARRFRAAPRCNGAKIIARDRSCRAARALTGSADREIVDAQRGLTNAHRHALALFAAGADAIVEFQIVADHRHAGQHVRTVADQRRAFDRRTDPTVFDEVRLGGRRTRIYPR
jgi:hypothetical protein